MNTRLIEYIPRFLRDVIEYKLLLSAGDGLFAGLYEKIALEMDNRFIRSADEPTIARWEKFLGIVTRPEYTLEYRKLRVLSYHDAPFIYTLYGLREHLNAMFGIGNYNISVDYPRYTVYIRAPEDALVGLRVEVRRIIPANMLLYVDSKNVHGHIHARVYTHGDLRVFTHKQINEEVL
jgi:hypothetical protein